MKNSLLFTVFLILGMSACTSQTEQKGYTDLNVPAFKAKMAEPGIVLLDVRTPEETALGMIEGAGQIDFESANFETEVGKLDKNKTYLIYCRSGNRSGQACNYMAEKGFKHLYNLKGGYLAWTGE